MPVETELRPQRRTTRTFVVMGPGSRSLRSLVRDDGDRFDFQTATSESVIARSEATKQSILPLRGEMDCFASLAMTSNFKYDSAFPRR
jgi:hypothetical protein